MRTAPWASLGHTVPRYRPRMPPSGCAPACAPDASTSTPVQATLTAAGHPAPRRHSQPARLSVREIEILRLIARGLYSRQIAAELLIAPKTVRNHTEHIYAKTGIGNRVAASLYAIDHGLIPAD